MSFIQCSSDCKHQKDGYCKLESISRVTNAKKEGCAHFIKAHPGKSKDTEVQY